MAGNALNRDRYYVGQGDAALYLRTPAGTRGVGRLIGCAPKIQILGKTAEVRHQESRTGKRFVDDKIVWTPETRLNLTIDNFNCKNLAWIFGGKCQTVNAGSVTGETVIAGPAMQLANPGPSNVVLKKAAATVPSGNYQVYPSGLLEALVAPLNTGISDGDSLTADYSFASYEEVGAFNDTSREYWFNTSAINLSPSVDGSGTSVVSLDCFRVIFMPNFQFDLIGNDYGTLSIEGEILLDSKQPSNAIGGQFFRERQAVQV